MPIKVYGAYRALDTILLNVARPAGVDYLKTRVYRRKMRDHLETLCLMKERAGTRADRLALPINLYNLWTLDWGVVAANPFTVPRSKTWSVQRWTASIPRGIRTVPASRPTDRAVTLAQLRDGQVGGVRGAGDRS